MIPLKKWREKTGFSQEMTAEFLELSRRQIQLIEEGRAELRLTMHTFQKYIEAIKGK